MVGKLQVGLEFHANPAIIVAPSVSTNSVSQIILLVLAVLVVLVQLVVLDIRQIWV